MNACELTEEEFNELLRLSRLYHREAKRCMAAKSYLAGCVMIGSALEASLMSMCHVYADEIPGELLPKNKTKQKPLLQWTLAQLLRVARNCGWLPTGLALDDDWNRRKAKIGDYAVVLKQVRNLVHPGVYMTDFPKSRMTKRRFEWCFEIFEVATDHLVSKVYASIRKSLAEEERGNPESNDT
jgi:hypothetical protein